MGDAEGLWENGGVGYGSNITEVYGGDLGGGIRGVPEVVSLLSSSATVGEIVKETVVPSVRGEFGETVGWIGATMTTTVATMLATSVESAPMAAKASSLWAFVKVVPTVEPRVGEECRVNGGTALAGWRFTPGGCEE